MQIKDLPSSSTLASTDVLAKDTSGGTTQKISGVDLASQVKSLGSLLGTSDVVNNLTSGGTTVPLSAEMGKKLGVHDLGNFSTLAALETEIGNELSNLELGQQADIKFMNQATFGLFVWSGTWTGTLQKNSNTRGIIKCFLEAALPPRIIYGDYKDGTCVWNLSSATKGDITGAASTISEMFGYYVYSPSDRMVRIYISARSSSNITTSTVLGVIPSGYRPSSNATLVGAMGTGTGMAAYKGHVNTSGEIYQDIGNTLREIFLVGEYYMY